MIDGDDTAEVSAQLEPARRAVQAAEKALHRERIGVEEPAAEA